MSERPEFYIPLPKGPMTLREWIGWFAACPFLMGAQVFARASVLCSRAVNRIVMWATHQESRRQP